MSEITDKLQLKVQDAQIVAGRGFYALSRGLQRMIIIFAVLIIPAFYGTRAITRAAYAKKYSQYLLAAHPSFTNPKTPDVADMRVINYGNGTFSAVAAVVNNNLELSADNIQYRFDFYSGDGSAAGSQTGAMFLLPGEKKYVVVPKISSASNIVSAQLNFTAPISWKKRLNIPNITLNAPAAAVYAQSVPPATAAEGSYQNQSAYVLKSVHLVALLYDQQNNLVAATSRDDFNIKPLEQRGYVLLWPQLANVSGLKAIVQAQTDPLDPNNLLLPGAAQNSSSDLSRPGAGQ